MASTVVAHSWAAMASAIAIGILTAIAWNLIKQIFFPDSSRPPVVFHWLPLIGSTVYYGKDPYKFFFECRKKYGDCFTFILLGRPTTVFLGSVGNEFILNGKIKDLNAEEVYGPLTKPVFGEGVVYDVPNSKLMDQKRILGPGLNEKALVQYVPMFVKEVEQYINTSPVFQKDGGICDISSVLDQVTIYTAAGSLQGKEIRDLLDAEVSVLYRHLDDGFAPINFVMPWLPIPRNFRRDHAQRSMKELYLGVIRARRARKPTTTSQHDAVAEPDMLDILMTSSYKDGTRITDPEVANLMIALLMGGQHNTTSTGAWIMLHLAHEPELQEELYREQVAVLGASLSSPLTYAHLQRMPLLNNVVRETLRLHSPIHSIMRKVKSDMAVPTSAKWVVPAGYTLLAAPNFMARTEEHFPRPAVWDPRRWDAAAAAAASGQGAGEDDDGGDKVDYGFGSVSLKSIRSPYLPFGGGRHRCVAEKYAYGQLNAIIATMVRLLQWEQVDRDAPVPPTDYSSMFSRPMHPANIAWRRRKA